MAREHRPEAADGCGVNSLEARFAATGFALEIHARRREWVVTGAGGTRTFHSLVEVEGFLDRQERAA